MNQNASPSKNALTLPCVLVCQYRTCRKQGAAAVLAQFQHLQPQGWAIYRSGCLGQCGNGPMVRILPEDVWYGRVQPETVAAIVTQHLIGGTAIAQLRYPLRHHHPPRTLMPPLQDRRFDATTLHHWPIWHHRRSTNA